MDILETGSKIMMNPKNLYLNFSEKQREQAWQNNQNYSNPAARWNAYLNYLCLTTLSEYWKDTEPSLLVPNSSDIWEFVNGSVVTIGKTRIIIIPHETIDTEEFSIPQEWVDISDWVGNYYVAVQIIPDDCWLRVWGFATHAQIKKEGTYELCDRTYSLTQDALTEEINGLWVLNKLGLSEITTVKNLVKLSESKAENLITELSSNLVYSSHLQVSFSEWGALVSNHELRHKLYLNRLKNSGSISSANSSVNGTGKLTHLSHWLDNLFEQGWQSIEELFASGRTVYALRNSAHQRFKNCSINDLIQQIYRGDPHQQRQAARSLGEITTQESEVIEALNYLIQTTLDEETRWTAAESLWNIVPNHPSVAIRRLKNLGIQMEGHYLALMIAILPKKNEKFSILLRVYPMGDKNCLPGNLKLIVLDGYHKTFLAAESRKIDSYIQLKFTGIKEEFFGVKLVLDSTEIMENFVI